MSVIEQWYHLDISQGISSIWGPVGENFGKVQFAPMTRPFKVQELQPLNIAVRYITRVLQSDDYVWGTEQWLVGSLGVRAHPGLSPTAIAHIYCSCRLAKFGMISELRWTKWVCLNICPPNPIFARHSHESGRKLCHGRPWPGSPFASWQRRAEHLKASGFFLSSAIWNTWDFSFHLEYLEYSNKITLKCVSV